jgi:hypothetical protein
MPSLQNFNACVNTDMIELISNHFVAFIRAQISFSNLRVFSFPVFLSKELHNKNNPTTFSKGLNLKKATAEDYL